jgi:hypothetical protein
MTMITFWDIAPCSLVEVSGRFRGAYCLHHQDDKSAARKKSGRDIGISWIR